MPIKINIKADFSDAVYLKRDNQQIPYTFVGFRVGPGHIIYNLSSGLEVFEAYDFECSFERDEAFRLSFNDSID